MVDLSRVIKVVQQFDVRTIRILNDVLAIRHGLFCGGFLEMAGMFVCRNNVHYNYDI